MSPTYEELEAHVLLLVEALKVAYDAHKFGHYPWLAQANDALHSPPIQKQVRVSELMEKVVEMAMKIDWIYFGEGIPDSETKPEKIKLHEALRILREEEGK